MIFCKICLYSSGKKNNVINDKKILISKYFEQKCGIKIRIKKKFEEEASK